MSRAAILCLFLLSSPAVAQDFKLPKGYTITEFAGDVLVPDAINITIDPNGRVVVSGKNYIKILLDENNDGKADAVIDFAKEPGSGAHGLLWENDTLYFVGDGALRKLVDKNGDDKADGPSTIVRKVTTGSEHGAHTLKRGPDGWLYLIGGDSAGFDEKFAELPTSPVKVPLGGCVVRFHPESMKSEIVCHGLRNPYGFDFDQHGRLFTYDSDNERCIGMPWYEHTRFYQVFEGAFYGWLGPGVSPRLWRMQPEAPDVVGPLATFGRGSPTFVIAAGPDVLLGDWTFGRVHQATVPRESIGIAKNKKTFLEPPPTDGFAPTSAVVHPKTGDIYLTIGGRGTRGAVYRIQGNPPPAKADGPPLATVAISEADIVKGAASTDPLVRLRTLEHIAWLGKDLGGFKKDLITAAIQGNWDAPNRALSFAAARAAAEHPDLVIEKRFRNLYARRTDLVSRILLGDEFDPAYTIPLIESDEDDLAVDGLCLLQRRLEVPGEPEAGWEGYSGKVTDEQRKALTPALVALMKSAKNGGPALKREAARTFALVVRDAPPEAIVQWLKSAKHPTEQFHLLACLGHSGSKLAKGETAVVAEALLGIDRAYEKQGVPRESNWETRFGELVPRLLLRDPELGPALLGHAEFGRAEHASLAMAKGFPREKAAPIFVDRLKDPDAPLSDKLIALLATVPGDDIVPLVRPRFGLAGFDEALLPLLARKPDASDQPRFVSGLKSLQAKTVDVSLAALTKLGQPATDDELVSLFTLWDQAGPKEKAQVAAIVERLKVGTKQTFDDRAEWQTWLKSSHPEVLKKLSLVDNVDRPAWQKRLEAIDWAKGDAAAGKAYFTKATCAACHSGTQTIGPDLAGVAGRFSRDDLFTAILQPNKEVADRYRVTEIATTDGKVHRGLIVYTAFDGVILRTGLAESVRVPGKSIESRATVARSLMPSGMLDAASDADLANLYAYLRELKK